MRRRIIAGNWKMNHDVNASIEFLENCKQTGIDHIAHELVIFPSEIAVHPVNDWLKSHDLPIELGAQNCHSEDKGAFTGEVSAAMLKASGVQHVLVGHSERRTLFNESNDFLLRKCQAVLANNQRVYFCCGETESERDAGIHFEVLDKQLQEVILKLPAGSFDKMVIAYEPVWAIGTGKTATPEMAQEMHKHIRHRVETVLGAEIASAVRILYGGSVKPDNAEELFAMPDIDGGLIGGASLKADSYLAIARA